MPAADSYLWHLTLDTGHGRRSYRSEAADAVVTIVAQDLAEARATGRAAIAGHPTYWLAPVSAEGALIATIESERDGPLVTIAVAAKSRISRKLWETIGATGDPPAPPWCAVRLYPGLGADLNAAQWLGDYERCLAWAWIEARAAT